MDHAAKNTKPIVSVDWTGTEGDTPFFEQSSSAHPARYCVAVDSQKITWPDFKQTYGTPHQTNPALLESGTLQILNFFNKNSQGLTPANVYASIPAEGSGTYIPIRPSGTIKVLVTIPDTYVDKSDPANLIYFRFDAIPENPPTKVGAYDEVRLNTFNFSQKAQNISKLLKKYDKEAKDFEGRVYNFNFGQQATKVANFAGVLTELVNNNKVSFPEDQSDLIMIGVSSSYAPLYAEINKGAGFARLITGFEQFKQSEFVDSNTMFIYKHFEEINTQAIDAGATAPAANPSITPDWQKFLNQYIKFPPAIIEYTDGRPASPKPDPALKKTTVEANSSPVLSTEELQRLEIKLKTKEVKMSLAQKQKASRDWVGDNVLGNLDKVIHQLHTLEDFYHKVLDKLGLTYIVKAALRCLHADLPFDDLEEILGDIRAFTVGVLEILKIPVINLDDIFPTVDIMGDIIVQVFWAVYEAVKKALWAMLQQIIYSLLDNCEDVCGAGYGGINLGALLSKPPGEILGRLAVPALAVAGDAAIAGVGHGLKSGDLNANSKKFLTNLKHKVSPEQLQTLVDPIPTQATAKAQKGISEAKAALSNSKIGKFFEKMSTTLTCGETQKVLEGKASPAVIKIVKSLVANDPDLKDLLGDADSINDFFGSAGKLIDNDELDAQMDALSQFYPDPCGNLADRQDSTLRCALLEGKEVPPEVCDWQFDSSLERAKGRATQLLTFLEAPQQTLQEAIPPIYCTYKDGKIVEGLVPNDHPSFSFMMKTTLDTTFMGVGNAFTYDVLRVPEVMQVETQGPPRQIDRVKPAPAFQCDPPNTPTAEKRLPGRFVEKKDGAGSAWLMMNPDFEMQVEQGFKPNPPYWKCPPTQEDGGEFSDPTPNPNYLEKTIIYNEWAQRQAPYSIPTKQIIYSPGMSGSGGVYGSFQTSYFNADSFTTPPTPLPQVDNALARKRLTVDQKSLQLSIENSLKKDLQTLDSPAGNLIDFLINSAQNDPTFMASLRQLGLENLFGPERYVVSLNSKLAAPGKDKFSVHITGDSNSGLDAQIYRKMFDLDIPPAAVEVIEQENLNYATSITDGSTKEKHFVQFLQKIWANGENIYTGSVDDLVLLTPADFPVSQLDYCRWFAPAATRGGMAHGGPDIYNALLADQLPSEGIKSLFEELSRDLMAETLTEVGTSALLQENAGDLFRLINFAPTPRPGCPDLSLLSLETIKDDIFERYKDAQCIEKSAPNVSGLGDNRDNAFESAALFGIVKTTVRTYALEIVLKTLPTFSTLQAKDLDDVFIVYLREHMTGEIRGKGYLDEFLSQSLKAYNLIAASIEGQAIGLEPVTDPIVALDYFIREEMRYAAGKVLSISGLGNPNKSISNLLIQNKIQPNDPDAGWFPDFYAGDSQLWVPQNRIQDDWHVGSTDKILGIKDPINGSFVIEKYIRFEAQDYWDDPALAQEWSEVENPEAFDIRFRSVTWNDSFLNEAHQNPNQNPPTPTPTTQIIEEDDCGPAGVLSTANVAPAPFPIPVETVGRYFKSIRYGLRLVCKSGNNPGLDAAMKRSDPYPVAPGQIDDAIFHFPKALKNKSYLISDQPQEIDFTTNSANYNRFAFPIVCVERDVDPHTLISEIGATNEFFEDNYKKESPQLICMLKNTKEYKFMFDYCFPMERLVSLAVLYNAAYVLPFPGLNDVFMNTKANLRAAFLAMLNSGNYQYQDFRYDQKSQALDVANGQALPDIDYGLMALQFIFGIMKGAGEAFSPNISIARKIQLLTEKIGAGLVATINKAKEVGNRANEISQGDFEGGNSGNVTGAVMTECDLPDWLRNFPEIPIILISLGLVPMDLFFPIPGPPLGPLGYMYLTLFGTKFWPFNTGHMILGTSADPFAPIKKEIDRCALKFPETGMGINILTNSPGDCPTGSIIQQFMDECAWGFDPFTGEANDPPEGFIPPNQHGAGGSPSLDVPSGEDEDGPPDIGREHATNPIPHDCD